jgi:hypothetical protein
MRCYLTGASIRACRAVFVSKQGAPPADLVMQGVRCFHILLVCSKSIVMGGVESAALPSGTLAEEGKEKS